MTDPLPRDCEEDPNKRYEFVGFGFPRSGTMYVQLVLVKLGFDVWHEDIGPDGGVGFFLSESGLPTVRQRGGKSKWCPPLKNIKHVAYIHRDPVKTCSSCLKNLQPSIYGQYAPLPRPTNPWELVVSSYTTYHALAKIRLEEARKAGCTVHDIDLSNDQTWLEKVLGQPTNTNHRASHKPPELNELFSLLPESTARAFIFDFYPEYYYKEYIVKKTQEE